MKISTMRIYFAASFFTQLKRVWNRSLAETIEKLYSDAEITLPQDFENKGYDNSRTNALLFQKCVGSIDNADVVLAVIDGANPDSGTAWEMGYAYAKGKPIIGVRTDFRLGAEHGVNIMLSRSCRFIVQGSTVEQDVNVVARRVAQKLKLVAAKGK